MRPDRTGRDGFLRLAFERRGSATVLCAARHRFPLQTLTPIPLDDGALYLMLLNPSGGVLGGDCLLTEISVGAGAHAILTTPSATRVYRTADAAAVHRMVFHLEEAATLEYQPDHLIPHPGAALEQSLELVMAAGSRAILYDGLAAGRIARGERWLFERMWLELSVTLSGRLVYLSRNRLPPRLAAMGNRGRAEHYNYLGTNAVFGADERLNPKLVAALNSILDGIADLQGGASQLASGGCIAKFMACNAEGLKRAARGTWASARQIILGRSAIDLRKL